MNYPNDGSQHNVRLRLARRFRVTSPIFGSFGVALSISGLTVCELQVKPFRKTREQSTHFDSEMSGCAGGDHVADSFNRGVRHAPLRQERASRVDSCPHERKACSSIRKQDHFAPTKELRNHAMAMDRNHSEGWKLQGHVSPAATNYLTYRIDTHRFC